MSIEAILLGMVVLGIIVITPIGAIALLALLWGTKPERPRRHARE